MEIINGLLEYLVLPIFVFGVLGYAAAYSENRMSQEAKEEYDRYDKFLTLAESLEEHSANEQHKPQSPEAETPRR